ncbi:MAG: hypothetical protein ACLQNG_16415 [Acidimicrobiales bacterium]
MIGSGSWRLRRLRRAGPAIPLFRPALAAAPVAVPTAFALAIVATVASVAFAPKQAVAGVVACGLVSVLTLFVALTIRSERAFLVSVFLLAGACAVADLPVHRSGAVVFAAAAGAAVLAFAEAGGAALEPLGGGTHVGRPGVRQTTWTAAVAVGGAAAGWLLLSLEPDLSGFGLAALGVGVVAAICVIALAASLSVRVTTDRRR